VSPEAFQVAMGVTGRSLDPEGEIPLLQLPAKDGCATMPAKELWADGPAVVLVLRRMG